MFLFVLKPETDMSKVPNVFPKARLLTLQEELFEVCALVDTIGSKINVTTLYEISNSYHIKSLNTSSNSF